VIDRELDRAERSWGRLPQVVRSIDTWPEDEALDFLNEWSLEEYNLAVLRERAARSELSPEQQARYQHVLEIVSRHRPLVARLLAD